MYAGNYKQQNNSSMSKSDYHILFHPSTGLCVEKGSNNQVLLAPCTPVHTAHIVRRNGRLELANSYLCIMADGDGQLAKFGVIGTQKNNGPWNMLSPAKLQLGTKLLNAHHYMNASSFAEMSMVALHQVNDHRIDVDDGIEDDAMGGPDCIDPSTCSTSKNVESGSLMLCLDGSSPPLVTTRKCVCILEDGVDCGKDDDPTSQWFVLVPTNRN
jgi:hypothetical protein